MAKNKKIDSNAESLQSYITRFYLMGMMLFFVLGFHDAFFDIAQAKRGIFIWISFIYLVLISFASLFEIKNIKNYKINTIDLCLLVFIITMFVSWLFSSDRTESFLGLTDKCTGMIIYLLGALVIFFISKNLAWSVGLTWCYLGSCCIVYFLQVINRFNIDPLSMYTDILQEQKCAYLSTLGHCNYNASFNCLTVCLCMVFFFLCQQMASKLVYGAMMFMGYMGSICCCADSVYLGIAVGFIVLFAYACLHPEKWYRFLGVTGLFVLANLVLYGIYMLAGGSDNAELIFWGASLSLLTVKVIILEIGLFAVLALVIFLGNKTKLLEKFSQWIFRIYLAVIALGIVGALVYAVSSFSDSWGSYRGFIWKNTMSMFAKSNLFHKLFGYGYNTFRSDMLAVTGVDAIPSGETIADAHNIYLNTLITSGIIGSIVLLIFVVTIIYKACKRECVSSEKRLFVLVGMLAFLVQGLLNGPQILTTPIVLLELGIFANFSRAKTE